MNKNINKYFYFFICAFLCLQPLYARNINKNNLYIKVDNNTDREFYFLSKHDEQIFNTIQQQIKRNKWTQAYNLQETISNECFKKAIKTYIDLQKFNSKKKFTPEELVLMMHFNYQNSFLSSFIRLNYIIENNYLNGVIKYDSVKKYFKQFPSKRIEVNIKLFRDLGRIIEVEQEYNKKRMMEKELDKQINEFWMFKELSNTDEEKFYNAFKDSIKDYSTTYRIDLKIFDKKDFYNTTKYLKDPDYKYLYFKIQEINKNPDSIKGILKDLKEFKNNEALLFTQVLYYRKNDKNKEFENIMLSLKEDGRFSKYWWNYRNIAGRDALAEKEYKKAYLIFSGFKGEKSYEYSEAEWLSGWTAFVFLKNYQLAFKHFNNYYNYVSYPSSVAQGAYWIGRLHESISNVNEAIKWYNKSAKYPMTFYGQIAHYAKYNILNSKGIEYKEIKFPELPQATETDIVNLDNNRVFKLSLLYYKYLNNREEGRKIFEHCVKNELKVKAEIVEFVRTIELLKDEVAIVSLARFASYKMVFFLDHLFPTLRMVKKTDPNIALIHAIIKQESGFVLQAESWVGAIGFMQIMPSTAQALCKELNITYNEYKLRHDGQYNIALGKYYIKSLINSFKGSKVLAISAYNAGPHNTMRWIKMFGDPRDSDNVESVVNWIESINFKETRNYVKKVLENLIVYDYKLGLQE